MLSAPKDQGGVEPAIAREHLSKILSSQVFRPSPLQSAFLRFVVEKVLSGETEQIQGHEIAAQVYDRPADPSGRADPIVRLEAARLRSRLREYYSNEGRGDEIRIVLRKGTYVPEFIAASEIRLTVAKTPPEEIRPAKKPSWFQPRRVALIAATVFAPALAAIVWVVATSPDGSPLSPPNTKIPVSIAILPAHDAKAPANDEQFGRPITDALAAEMSQTAFPFWRRRVAVKRGQQDAEAVMRASLSVDGGVLRVQCSLERLPAKEVLWSGAIERKLADWPESQRGLLYEDIAFSAAGSLNAALTKRAEQELAALYPPRAEAHRAWLEGEDLWRRGDENSVRRAIALLERAASLDPNFAWSHASLAHAYVRALELGIYPDSYRARAHDEAARAQELGPALPYAQAAAARVSLALDWNLHAASATCASALNLLPAAYTIRSQCAQVYSLNGRNDQAAQLDERSARRYEWKGLPLTDLAWVRYRQRQFDEAGKVAASAITADGENLSARMVQAMAAMAGGQSQVALDLLREGPVDRTGRIAALVATALALIGDGRNAEEELDDASQQLRRPDRTDLIRPYLALRLSSRAQTVIEEGLAQRNAGLLELLVDPQIAELDREGLFERVRARLRN